MREIVPHQLSIGNAIEAEDISSVLALGVEALIDLAANEKPLTVTRDLVYCRFPINDGSGNSPERLRTAVEVVASLIARDISTLVFCSAGMSRSVAITAAALAVARKNPLKTCWLRWPQWGRTTCHLCCGAKSARRGKIEMGSLMESEIAPNHFVLSIRRELESTRVFRTGWRLGEVRPEFADLLCERCGRIDELRALQRGIPAEVRIRRSIDVVNSGDDMVLVSRRVADILTDAAGTDAAFFPFQDDEYAVVWPLNVVEVDADSPLNRKRHTPKQAVSLREPHCSECGRPGAVTVRPEFGNYAEDDKLVGLRAEGRGASFMLVAHSHIGDVLEDEGVSGWKREKIVPFTYKG